MNENITEPVLVNYFYHGFLTYTDEIFEGSQKINS